MCVAKTMKKKVRYLVKQSEPPNSQQLPIFWFLFQYERNQSQEVLVSWKKLKHCGIIHKTTSVMLVWKKRPRIMKSQHYDCLSWACLPTRATALVKVCSSAQFWSQSNYWLHLSQKLAAVWNLGTKRFGNPFPKLSRDLKLSQKIH